MTKPFMSSRFYVTGRMKFAKMSEISQDYESLVNFQKTKKFVAVMCSHYSVNNRLTSKMARVSNSNFSTRRRSQVNPCRPKTNFLWPESTNQDGTGYKVTMPYIPISSIFRFQNLTMQRFKPNVMEFCIALSRYFSFFQMNLANLTNLPNLVKMLTFYTKYPKISSKLS